MSETPRKRQRKRANGPRAQQEKKKKASAKVLVTLSLPQGDVIRVEKLARSGERHKLSEKEFAALIGGDEMDDLGAALEETYAAGVTDAIDDELDEFGGETELDRLMLHEAAGRAVAKHGVSKLILRRALRREMVRKRTHPRRAPHKGASGPPG